jgi:hypothetical protein
MKNEENILNIVENDPSTSIRRAAAAAGTSAVSAWTAL